MYMPGRFLTGSRPSSTVMSFAVYVAIQENQVLQGSTRFYKVRGSGFDRNAVIETYGRECCCGGANILKKPLRVSAVLLRKTDHTAAACSLLRRSAWQERVVSRISSCGSSRFKSVTASMCSRAPTCFARF